MNQPIQIIYASTSGHTEAVCEFVADRWQQKKIEVHLHRAEQASIELVQHHQLFVLATSTWHHGDANPFFRPLMSAMKQEDLSGKYAAFIGLGDSRYEPVLFNGGMDLLQQRWWSQNGKDLGQPLKINGEPFELLETKVADWADEVLEQFTQLK